MKFAGTYLDYYFGEECEERVNYTKMGDETRTFYNIFEKGYTTFRITFSFDLGIDFKVNLHDQKE